jgi:hypothetical protein
MAIKNEARRTTAQGMIDAAIIRVDANLSKIPLPPGSRDRHFDFERVLDENVISLCFEEIDCRERWRLVLTRIYY